MPEQIIHHQGSAYSLYPFRPQIYSLTWLCRDHRELNINVRVRYSPHCYSRSTSAIDVKDHIVHDHIADRIFCPIRYRLALHLPYKFETIIGDARRPVGMTFERNYTIFALDLPEIRHSKQIYYAFFRLKPGKAHRQKPDIDLFVESAYPRDTRVRIMRHLPFGRLVEDILSDHPAKRSRPATPSQSV